MTMIFQDMLLGPSISKNGSKKLAGGWSLIPNKDLAFINDLLKPKKQNI